MAEDPIMDFDTGDWKNDPALSLCKPATRGVWMDLLCAMHNAGRSGILRGTPEQLARTARCSTTDIDHALTDLETTDAAGIARDRNGVVTVTNRRMKKKADERKAAAERQFRHRAKGREPPDNGLSQKGHTSKTSDVRKRQTSSNSSLHSKSFCASTSTSDVGKNGRNGKHPTSTRDADARIKVSEEEMPGILEECRRVTDTVPLSTRQDQHRKDRSLVFKAVVLSRTRLSEDWLHDSLEAVRRHPGAAKKMAYFHGVLKSKCGAIGENFNQLLKLVEIPESVFSPAADIPRPELKRP